MSEADSILLALDAQECLGALGKKRSKRAERGPQVEAPVLNRGHADFGTTLAGNQSIAELRDSLKSWDYKMKQLAAAYAAFAKTWQARDPAAFADWTNDWRNLQARYAAGVLAANSDISQQSSVLVPDSMQGAQAGWDALSKAMRQCYPPDGCPIAKGDFMDLETRLQAAGAAPDFSKIPQPTATDVSLQVFKATAPLDVVAMSTGEQLPKGPLAPFAGPLKWILDHRMAILWTTGIIVGGSLILQIWPALMMPVKAAKGITAAVAV